MKEKGIAAEAELGARKRKAEQSPQNLLMLLKLFSCVWVPSTNVGNEEK